MNGNKTVSSYIWLSASESWTGATMTAIKLTQVTDFSHKILIIKQTIPLSSTVLSRITKTKCEFIVK